MKIFKNWSELMAIKKHNCSLYKNQEETHRENCAWRKNSIFQRGEILRFNFGWETKLEHSTGESNRQGSNYTLSKDDR